MSSDLHIAADKRFRHPRPASVVITQILIVISFVPIFLGLIYALVMNWPDSLLSIRGLIIFSTAFGVVAVFMIFGFRGLKNGQRYGYWIGLVFLVLAIISNIYKIVLTVQAFRFSHDLTDRRIMLPVGLAIQAGILLFFLVLLLKFVLGKPERLFFSRS